MMLHATPWVFVIQGSEKYKEIADLRRSQQPLTKELHLDMVQGKVK